MLILYVEDNDDNIYMLSSRLTRLGHQVEIARDGREGVERARTLRPDVILMDLGLPVMDGWEATRVLKKDADTRLIPIIALTAHAMPDELKRALDAGCDDIDTKPVSLKRLKTKIAALVPEKTGAA